MLDVVTHGVTFGTGGANRSTHGGDNPFLTEQGSYFFHLGNNDSTRTIGKWEMADFNYGVEAFRTWFISVWVNYVTEFNVDGFRLDGPNGISGASDVFRLFDEVVQQTKAAGKAIVILGEEGDFHFGEHDVAAPSGKGMPPSPAAFVTNTNPGPNESGCFRSIMFSCHDGGFDHPRSTAAAKVNYYGVQGSRASLGYFGVFGVHIPVMFSGEEADMDAVYMPSLTTGAYEGAAGTGGWLYGSMYAWDQVNANVSKAAMLADTTRMFNIRKNESDVVHSNQCTTTIVPVAFKAGKAGMSNGTRNANTANRSIVAGEDGHRPTPNSWQPYARYIKGTKAVVVAGNPNLVPMALTLDVPLELMGFSATGQFMLEDLWKGTPPQQVDGSVLSAWAVTLGADQSAGGGLAVFKITPV